MSRIGTSSLRNSSRCSLVLPKLFPKVRPGLVFGIKITFSEKAPIFYLSNKLKVRGKLLESDFERKLFIEKR